MIKFPDIDPVIVSFGSLAISWYSMAYVAGVLVGWYYARKIIQLNHGGGITKKHLEDFVSWSIISIVIGGRLGYVLFYEPVKYFSDPIEILKTYKGGMSFHGGFIGLVVGSYIFCRKYQIRFLSFCDILAVVAPIGLFLGRIANFINAEHYGRITNVPWAIVFPYSDGLPRHPSQLYEAFLEGVAIFAIMAYLVFCTGLLRKAGKLSAVFLISYGFFRIIVEFFREPDGAGYFLDYFTLGQELSMPMIFFGIYLFLKNNNTRSNGY